MRIRSGYSFRTAVGKADAVHKAVLSLDLKAAPISDRNSTFIFSRWDKLCKKSNIKPVFGVELGASFNIEDKKPTISYFTFFAKENIRSINELVFLATCQPNAILSYEQVCSAKDVIVICDNRVIIDYIAPKDDLYIAMSPSMSIGLYRSAKDKGFRFIASSDNYYPTIDKEDEYLVMLGRNSSTQTYPQHILTDSEWVDSLSSSINIDDKINAVYNRAKALEACNCTLNKAEMYPPYRPAPLRDLCLFGAKRLGLDISNNIYSERLEHELKLIKEKNFEDYFYIVADMMQYSRSIMFCGPARGSSAGSLVCYLLDITSVDPIKHGLLFERFIDVTREDLPDIDLDFNDMKRHLVFEYIEATYGKEHTSRLGTVTEYKPRSILNGACYNLGIPKWLSDRVADSLVERASADSRAITSFKETFSESEMGRRLLKEYPEIKVVFDFENHPNNSGMHAAGMIITKNKVLDCVAIDARNNTTMCDKKDAEYLDLLKVDMLGLSQLSVFERTLELIGKSPIDRFLESLPLDTPEAFEVLNKKHFAGIFQANGKSLQILFQSIETDCFNDIVAITSLSRPGGVGSGAAVRWAHKKSGRAPITYANSALEPYLKETLGEVAYQEQIMSIGREIGELSWADVTALRRAMSKSMGEVFFSQYRDKFVIGAIKHGFEYEEAYAFFGQLSKFGSWAFNKSHAVSYSLITYWCCWLKAHHPVEFAAATLDSESDPARQIQLLRELENEGIKYVPVDPEFSIDKWFIREKDGKKILIGPLTAIKGIGPAAVEKIMTARKNNLPLTPSIMDKLLAAKTEIDSLKPVTDAIEKLHPDLSKINIFSKPSKIIDLDKGIKGEYMIFCVVNKIQPRDLNDLQNLAKRDGRRVDGPSWILNMFVRDDTDEIMCKIHQKDFETVGRTIIERGGQGDSLYAIKGVIPATFRMINVSQIRYLGKISDTQKKTLSVDLFA